MTADERLVGIQSAERSDVLLVTNPAERSFQRIATATGSVASPTVSWATEGRVVYSSNAAGSYDLYIVNADGSNLRQLRFDRDSHEIEPAASPDGRFIVFSSNRSGEYGLYRIRPDGTGLTPITQPVRGQDDKEPSVTPNGQHVIYRHWNNGPTLWTVSIEGGSPSLVKGDRSDKARSSDESAYGATVSPEGKRLAYFYFSRDLASGSTAGTYIVVGTLDGRISQRFAYSSERTAIVPDRRRVRWSPDGEAVYYSRYREGGGSDVWKQPLDGRPATRVTYLEGSIADFDWSRDGK